MRKIFYTNTFFLLFLVINNSYGQGWEKKFNSGVDLNLIMVTADGGVIYQYFENGNGDFVFERDDKSGRKLWQKRLPRVVASLGLYTGCGIEIHDIFQYHKDDFVAVFGPASCVTSDLIYFQMNINGDSIGHGLLQYNSYGIGTGQLSTVSDEIFWIDSSKYIMNTRLVITDTSTNQLYINSYKYDSVFNVVDSISIPTDCYRTKENKMNSNIYDLFFLDDKNPDYCYLYNVGGFDTLSIIYKINLRTGQQVFAKTVHKSILASSGTLWKNSLIKSTVFLDSSLYLFYPEDATSLDDCIGGFSCYDLVMIQIDKATGIEISRNNILTRTMLNLTNYFPINDSLFIVFGDFYTQSGFYNKVIINIHDLSYFFPSNTKYMASFRAYNTGSVITQLLKKGSSFYLWSAWDFLLARTDDNGFSLPHILSGNIFSDNNFDCRKNPGEYSLRDQTISVTKGTASYFGTSDKNGNYEIGIPDTGQFLVTIQDNPLYTLWSSTTCGSARNLFIRDTISFDSINFALQPSITCPFNTVNVSAFRLRQCTSQEFGYNTFYVSYCNNGTIASPNTYIDITLDSVFELESASVLYTALSANVYRIDIGNLDYLTCGAFTFVAIPRCDSIPHQTGQVGCVKAHIYPDTLCTVPNYTGPFIIASAQCLGDSVYLKLQNTGSGNMAQPKKYKVIEDNVLRINHNYQLNSNQILTETLKADSGRTYRILAEQPDNLPPVYGDNFATAAVENCTPVLTGVHTGFVTQFPNYDGTPSWSVSCNIIGGSYDPNEKIASPEGYGAQHYIEANTQIDYQINFQNTGNDTAFKVVVVDTISPFLDINSIQPEVASHGYQFQRTDSNVVQFIFDSIMLVDSFKNEALSHGFVKFKIQQKTNNPDGTKIYNKADIYFDYNAAIITNETYHTIGSDFIQVDLLTETKNIKYNVREVKVLPNPFRDKTQIMVESDPLKDAVMCLITTDGKIIKTIPSTGNTFDVYREDLSSGMYIFRIMQNKEVIATGKLIIQ